MDDRIITASRVDEDAQYEAGLRPRTLDDYIGQDRIRENLQVSVAAARTARGLEYTFTSRDPGWTFVLSVEEGARYSLNGDPVTPSTSGIRMTGTRNHVLVTR